MRRIAVRFSLIVGIAALASLAIAACADGDPTAPPKSDPASYTQFFVQRAIDRYEEDGRAETVAFYNSMDSVDGPWYLAIYDEDTNTIAHPLRKDFLGTSPRERSDVNGKPYGLEIAAATEEGPLGGLRVRQSHLRRDRAEAHLGRQVRRSSLPVRVVRARQLIQETAPDASRRRSSSGGVPSSPPRTRSLCWPSSGAGDAMRPGVRDRRHARP